ncbi:MAG TPA: OmpA family protein [Longimicrobiales bacterium]|nr:OmpA family protein [Longimicrobiales bacterium]
MTTRSAAATAGICLLSGLAAWPAGAAAQRAPSFAGVEGRVGLAFPEKASAGPSAMAEVDLGYLGQPELRLIAGIGRFSANIDREPGDDEGSFSATGVWLGGRYELFALRPTSAYLRAAATVHRVDADAWSSDVGDLLSGTVVGAAVAAGASRALDPHGRLNGTVEVRRTFLSNVGHTAVEIGVRWLRRGSVTYTPDAVALAPPVRPLDEPGGLRLPPPAPRPAEPAERADAAAARRLADEPAPQPDPAAAEEAARAEARRLAELAEQRAREAAMEEQRTAAVIAERAAAAEALLRQGLGRASSAMRSVSSVTETDDAFIVTLGGTAFASGAAALAASARSELRTLATVLAGYPGHIVSVEGHTDAVGNSAANQDLSVERAAAVRAALIVEGVDPLWVGVRGFGADRPVASNDTAAGRAANRRVEIRVLRRPCPVPPGPDADGALACPAGR